MKKLILILLISVNSFSQSDRDLKWHLESYYTEHEIVNKQDVTVQYAVYGEKDEHFTIYAKSTQNGWKWTIRVNKECLDPFHCVYAGLDIIYKEIEKA